MASWDEKLCTAAYEGNIKDVELSLKNGANLENTSYGVSEVEIFKTYKDAGNADDFCECDNSQVKLNTCKEQDTDLDSQLTELLQQSTSDWKTDNASDRNNFNQPNK
ncbi:Hypothetical predicted protein [Mytilus galloprovincialis]|uniref:Uncharacterized protein n=1 Tax=Mytilus galloprovincialis TaxID=29158 RepID=A0A8B6CUU7_MYTGA|nr:Hypothetical predicted protein [Mytilus galloprovincialis]